MRRFLLSLVVLLAVSTLCPGMTASRPYVPLAQRFSALRTTKPVQEVRLPRSVSPSKDASLEVTATTEVKVDGRPCRYEDVPANVEAVLIELADDGKTILKIHFRARKR